MLVRPEPAHDPQAELIRRKGDEHERAYLAQLRGGGKSVLVVETDDRDWERAARVTADAIRSGSHDVVYQGVFVDPDGWRGIADFIERQADGSYEVSDTKLARHSKPYFLLQLSFYSEQLGRVQGRLPERMHVVLGTNDRESFRVADFIAYYRRVRARFLGFVERSPETYPVPVSHCQICTWRAVCEQRWLDDDHLSLVANMRRSWIAKLGSLSSRFRIAPRANARGGAKELEARVLRPRAARAGNAADELVPCAVTSLERGNGGTPP